jgi:K+-sensing histidine kinase KdpD
MPRSKLSSPNLPSGIQRYGLAILSATMALGIGLLLERSHFHDVEFPLFLLAIVVTVWYAGVGPGILAVVLSSLSFDFFFTEPIYSLYINRSEIPYYIVFILFALLLTWFSAVRRRVERDLLESRDKL